MNKTKVITVTIDASGKPIGRVASQVAHVLQGSIVRICEAKKGSNGSCLCDKY